MGVVDALVVVRALVARIEPQLAQGDPAISSIQVGSLDRRNGLVIGAGIGSKVE